MMKEAKFLKFGALFRISAILKNINEDILLLKEIFWIRDPALEVFAKIWGAFLGLRQLKILREDTGRE